MTKTFQTTIKIGFRDADPAGIMFFGNILGLSHDVFEEFIAHNGISWNEWFKPTQWACPIRHAEVNFLSPFRPGETYTVEVNVKKLGQSSFQMHYKFMSRDQKICAEVDVVHAFVDQGSFQKAPMPPHFRAIFSQYCSHQ